MDTITVAGSFRPDVFSSVYFVICHCSLIIDHVGFQVANRTAVQASKLF